MTNQYHVGENFVPAYQLSATPFVTGSDLALGQTNEIAFGSVSRFLVIRNTGPDDSVMAVGFTENGLQPVNRNFFFLSGSESFAAELRVDRVFLSGSSGSSSYTVIAGLTGIPTSRFLPVTASNGYPGVG